VYDREPEMHPTGVSYLEMRWRGLRFGPEALTSAQAQEVSTSVPPNRSPEQDLNLPPDTVQEWSMRPKTP
jgi:hypothetical protein